MSVLLQEPAQIVPPIEREGAAASLSMSDLNLTSFQVKTESLRDLESTGEAGDLSQASASFPTVEEVRETVVVPRKRSRRTCLLLALVFVVVAAAVGISLGVVKSQENSKSSASKEVPPAGQGEEVPPDGPFAQLVSYLASEGISDLNDLMTVGSPQNAAARWMSLEDGARLQLPTTSGIEDSYSYLFVFRYVMAVMYLSMNGPYWADQLNFLTSAETCDWNGPSLGVEGSNLGWETGGVLCSSDNGAPVVLDLEIVNAIGTLPTEIGLLTTLAGLDLDYNDIQGELPTELCNLSNLRYLLLKNNQLEGEVPSCLANLKDVVILDLMENAFSGAPPFEEAFCQMDQLQLLGLEKNLFEGTVPNCVSGLTNLRTLSLSDNLFEGEIPGFERLAENLLQLFLDGNAFSGNPISKFNQLTNLDFLFAEGNRFDGSIDGIATTMGTLVALDLSSNLFTTSNGVAIPRHLLQHPTLRVLDISNNLLEGTIPQDISSQSEIFFLSIHLNKMTGSIPNAISNMTKLVHLDVSNNFFSGPFPAGTLQLSSLRNLFLSDNGLDPGPIPSSISSMTGLREISFKNINLTGRLPELLGFNNLFLLDLDNNDLTGSIPANYGQLTWLRHLLLNRNKLTGAVPDFSGAENLGTIILDGTNVTGDLTSVCLLPGFTGEVELPAEVIAITDCGEVECPCCHCCEKSDTGCSDPMIASLDWTWEDQLYRTVRDFAIDYGGLTPPEPTVDGGDRL